MALASQVSKHPSQGGRTCCGLVEAMLGTHGGRDGAYAIQGGHVVGEGKKGGTTCGVRVGAQGQNQRSRRVGVIGRKHCSEACHDLFQNILDHLEYYNKVQREEHKVVITMLNQLHYFQCHVREIIVVVWHGKNLLSEKVEKLESWMAHFKKHS